MKRIAVRILIIWLAVTDFTVCMICIPFEIFDSMHHYIFEAPPAACKIFRYFGHATYPTSCSFLTTITIERGYLTWQNNVKNSRKSTNLLSISYYDLFKKKYAPYVSRRERGGSENLNLV